ncbi:hypothetical protein NMA58_07570 [Rhizobium sp. YTUHZ045]|uniref:hypothetical protein n=1 Tax=Rhizobium sp. YTUHZ045 TaxID=2962888 RepID=UPI003DAA1084
MNEEMMDISPRINAFEYLTHLETELRLGKRSCYSRAELVDAFRHVRLQVAAHKDNPETPGLLVRIDQDLAEISR